MKKDVSDMEMKDLIKLHDKNVCEPNEYESKPEHKKEFVIHRIIDDMLGTNLFKLGRSAFTRWIRTPPLVFSFMTGGLIITKAAPGSSRTLN